MGIKKAAIAYQRFVAIEPGNADAHNNLGALLKAQGRMKKAAATYETALALDPEHVAAYNNIGNLLSSEGRHKGAVAYYSKAISLHPNDAGSKHRLGFAYYALGRIDAAAEVFRLWQQGEPGHPIARHMLAACTGENVPARASDAYVETVFDGFAASFDAKLEQLSYRAPNLIAESVAKVAGAPAKRLVALDAGCGTGLCGPLLAPYVSPQTGVDLSARMLDAARLRGVYHVLVKGDLTGYIETHADSCDLIVFADTLCYFGRLDPVLYAACRALHDGGLLVFTVEATAEDGLPKGYSINPHGRYTHARTYVSRALAAAGLAELAIEPAVCVRRTRSPWTVSS